jgi:hypothetical protein
MRRRDRVEIATWIGLGAAWGAWVTAALAQWLRTRDVGGPHWDLLFPLGAVTLLVVWALILHRRLRD